MRYLIPVLALVLVPTVANAKGASAACSKLAQDFDTNEKAMAIAHDLNSSMLESSRKLADELQGYEASMEEHAKGRKLYEEMVREDQAGAQRGSQIIDLMTSHKCPNLPDHIASYYTYSKSNPNRSPL